jgi:hypothetical protein
MFHYRRFGDGSRKKSRFLVNQIVQSNLYHPSQLQQQGPPPRPLPRTPPPLVRRGGGALVGNMALPPPDALLRPLFSLPSFSLFLPLFWAVFSHGQYLLTDSSSDDKGPFSASASSGGRMTHGQKSMKFIAQYGGESNNARSDDRQGCQRGWS